MHVINIASTSDVAVTEKKQSGADVLSIINTDAGVAVTTDTMSGAFKPTFASSIRFSGKGDGEISAIAHDFAAVNPSRYRTTAASTLQAITLRDDTAAVDAKAEALAARGFSRCGV